MGIEAMAAIVLLNDIVDALEMQFDESSSFLDRDIGRWKLSRTFFCVRQRSPATTRSQIFLWQKQEWEIARRIVSTDRFQKFPTKFAVHEWAIRQNFSHSVGFERIREDLLHASRGAGAFRNFKDSLRRAAHRISFGCVPAEALRQVARCQELWGLSCWGRLSQLTIDGVGSR